MTVTLLVGVVTTLVDDRPVGLMLTIGFGILVGEGSGGRLLLGFES
jgi:hypothetical protein